MPEGISQYNWSKFILLSIAVILMCLGDNLNNNSKLAIFAACCKSTGVFGWGYFTHNGDNSSK